MAGGMTEPLGAWLDRHIAAAPPALRDRLVALTTALRGHHDLAPALAEAGRATVERVIASRGDRSEALNLLAADGLLTLSLLAKSESDPVELARWSAALLHLAAEDK
jgi:hypothetical protein